MQATSYRKNIVFVLPAFAGGGAERVLLTLMNGLDSEQFDKSLIAVSEEGPLRSLVNPDIPVYTLGKLLRASRSIFKLYKKLRLLKPEIIVTTMAHMNFTVLLLKPFFPRTRFIIREAITPSFFLQEKGFKAAIIRYGYKALYPFADQIISPAQIIIDEFRNLLKINIKNHVLLPNPVDEARMRSEAISENVKGIWFVCSGRLNPQKGFDRLIEVLPSLETDWHLTILGEGEQRQELEAMISELGLSDRISLPGFKHHPWSVIAGADAFLLPSRHEGLPNVVLESLACGTPVIAMREAGGVEEIAKQVSANNLQIVDKMDEFLSLMRLVKKRSGDFPGHSLLPEIYRKQNVIREFSQILLRNLRHEKID